MDYRKSYRFAGWLNEAYFILKKGLIVKYVNQAKVISVDIDYFVFG